jgi:hypothetical protein
VHIDRLFIHSLSAGENVYENEVFSYQFHRLDSVHIPPIMQFLSSFSGSFGSVVSYVWTP